jgi:hypothetical protein
MSVSVLIQYPTDNVAPGYATLGVNTGSEDADYPAAYLADGRPGRPAKLTTTSGSWVFSFGAAQRIDLVALGAHNLTAATLEGNATNTWGGPTFSQALTIPPVTADGHSVNAWCDLTAAAGYSVGGFQYWRLVVTSASACAVGELWLGATRRQTARGYALGFSIEETQPTITHLTEFLIPLVYALGSRQRRLALSFRATATGALALREWYRAMQGPGQTGLFVPDADVNDAWWVRHAGDYAEAVPYAEARDVSMTLVEHATGVPL